MISIQNLSKSFGAKQVLKNITIQFNKGQVYGIVGENGAGKTTLFRCIAGLENYEGQIISELSPLKNHLGLLFTEPFFFTKITGREYIRLLCNARKERVSNIDDKNIFDLPLNQYASTYSTGMKKKLALLAILLQNNQCFVLDEPFNGVDIHSNIIIIDLIHKLKDLGKTIIISSHIFSTLSDTCDEIYLLKEGEIIQKVFREDFEALELEMREFTVGNKIERLELK
ncbi:MAG TPA: ATP-binding cassette domain-containing protein [Bacteroidales bacterium]|jgi:ABC-2 type transport system ATP-binding protein|nr:ATP-binding cassette domain-containing protein [Bacteroidales bacterium]MBP7874974.1 ATP-binding cassette domain-containing protein [Bacteroidales bacterium]MCZ2282164.1 ATP-binding cassette domain-containing protein [Bacteroidales bacterium]NLH32700.1 ATP-binding cassette domain-containing protein [Lentimicrobium sp.]HPX34546.1 ATP-binding cassette domain-containing protein [Bacteroidales bacterium]